jgi:hypothetical protein
MSSASFRRHAEHRFSSRTPGVRVANHRSRPVIPRARRGYGAVPPLVGHRAPRIHPREFRVDPRVVVRHGPSASLTRRRIRAARVSPARTPRAVRGLDGAPRYLRHGPCDSNPPGAPQRRGTLLGPYPWTAPLKPTPGVAPLEVARIASIGAERGAGVGHRRCDRDGSGPIVPAPRRFQGQAKNMPGIQRSADSCPAAISECVGVRWEGRSCSNGSEGAPWTPPS